jgi:hypothetical protein
MPRKIIQIAATRETENYSPRLYALADDGSLWFLADPDERDTPKSWTALPNVPQPEPTDAQEIG